MRKYAFAILLFLLCGFGMVKAEYSIWIIELQIVSEQGTEKGYISLMPYQFGYEEDAVSQLDLHLIKEQSRGAASMNFSQYCDTVQVGDFDRVIQLHGAKKLPWESVKSVKGRLYSVTSFFSSYFVRNPAPHKKVIKESEIFIKDTVTCGSCFFYLIGLNRSHRTISEIKAMKSKLSALSCSNTETDTIFSKNTNPNIFVLCLPDPEK